MSSFSLATSDSSPVSQNPPVKPARNPHAQPDVSASREPSPDFAGPYAQELDPAVQQIEEADVTALERNLGFSDRRAAEPPAEPGRPSIAAALGLSETSSEEEPEGVETERTAFGDTGNFGGVSPEKTGLSSYSASTSPEGEASTIAGRGFREAYSPALTQGRSMEERSWPGESADAGDRSPSVESPSPSSPHLSERFSPSDQSLTATWQYRSSSLLAAPAAYRTGTQMAPLPEEWVEGFRVPEEGIPDEGTPEVVVSRRSVELQSVLTERLVAQVADDERKDGTTEAAVLVVGPPECRTEAESHEEALSFAPLPNSPRFFPREKASSDHWRPSPLEKPEAHFTEDLLRRSLSPPAAARTLKPPNVAAALALLDRPSELLTFDEQLEALAGELRKLDHRLHVATSQSVSSLLGSGAAGRAPGEVHRENLEEQNREVGGRGRSPDAVQMSEAEEGAGADVTSPASDDHTAGVSDLEARDASPQAGAADVSSREADAGSPLREDSDVRSRAPLSATEAERRESGGLSETSGLDRTEPESSASPEQRPAFAPVTGRIDIASLSSVGWAAALDIDGPDSLLAGSADFSPWRGSDVSDPSPVLEGLARGGTGMHASVPFPVPAFAGGPTASSGAVEAEGQDDFSPDVGNLPHGSGLNLASKGAGTAMSKAAEKGGSKITGGQRGVGLGKGTLERHTPSPRKRVSSSRPAVAEQRPVSAPRGATASDLWKRGMVAESVAKKDSAGKKRTGLAARSNTSSPVPRPPRNKAGLPERTRQSGAASSAGQGKEAPSPTAELRKPPGKSADNESGAVRRPSNISGSGGSASSAGRGGSAPGPSAEPEQAAETPRAADSRSGAVRSPSKMSGPPTPGSVRSSWSSFTSGRSPREKEPGRRYEESLRGGAEQDPGGRPGSREEAEKRKRAKELKEKARAFDKVRKDRSSKLE